MWTFLLILVLVFAAVDLLVRFIVDPLASKKKRRLETRDAINMTSMGLVGATMYDGGKSKDVKDEKAKTDNGENKNEEHPE